MQNVDLFIVIRMAGSAIPQFVLFFGESPRRRWTATTFCVVRRSLSTHATQKESGAALPSCHDAHIQLENRCDRPSVADHTGTILRQKPLIAPPVVV